MLRKNHTARCRLNGYGAENCCRCPSFFEVNGYAPEKCRLLTLFAHLSLLFTGEWTSESALSGFKRGSHTPRILNGYGAEYAFEDLPASEISAQKAYLTQAAACHIYLGIFGIQYGYEDADGVSPTEREYDTATAHFAHRLIYTLRTNTERHPKEQAFISKVEQEVVRRGFSTYEELRTAVYNSLIDYLVKKEVIRRVPFDAAAHPTATYDDIDPERVRTFVNKAREKRKFSLTFADGIEQIFSGIHVLTDDGRLTNSALLLFAKDPQRFFRTSEVRCAQFYGTKVEKPIRNYQVFTGTLFEMIDKAVGFVMSRIDARVGTRNQSPDAPVEYELPESAVAEAIANAVLCKHLHNMAFIVAASHA